VGVRRRPLDGIDVDARGLKQRAPRSGGLRAVQRLSAGEVRVELAGLRPLREGVDLGLRGDCLVVDHGCSPSS
jgi:hypothetical protein